ncbi:MAG: hypothetical protein MUC92_07150, partial [Fimbriimonadaceae bacterium]|nr:hypothetical protein [Fimbriimonadaceae bacterium]
WGSLYGTGIGAAAGMFLDYEYKWNQGDRMDGGVTISGLLRDDWGANIRQFWMLPDRTTISAQVDAPAHRSLFASTNIGKPFNGFSVNLNANYGRTLRGPAFENNSTSFVFEKDPIKTGKLPANLFLGFTSTNQSLKAGSSRESQSTLGFQARLVSNPIRFGPGMNGNASYRLAQLSGTNVQKGLTQQFNFSLGAAITEGLAMNLSYDFIDDGFSSSLLGQHRLTTEAYFSLGRTSFTAYFSRSLDVDRLESRGTFRYNMGSLWRFNYSGTFSKYLTDSYSDQSFIISYKLGFREIGLSYSQRTRRLGIELLGTSFN